MLDHVLVPLDGSPMAEKALDYVMRVVGADSKITLLAVITTGEGTTFFPTPGRVQKLDDQMLEARHYLQTVERMLRQQTEASVDIVVKIGDPASVIVESVEKLGAEAIVLCTHGRTGINRFIFGSVTYKVLSSMLCPVFVVPGTETASAPEPIEKLTYRPATG